MRTSGLICIRTLPTGRKKNSTETSSIRHRQAAAAARGTILCRRVGCFFSSKRRTWSKVCPT